MRWSLITIISVLPGMMHCTDKDEPKSIMSWMKSQNPSQKKLSNFVSNIRHRGKDRRH
jgi:hypothetical protein